MLSTQISWKKSFHNEIKRSLLRLISQTTISSSNGNIFRVTGLFCGAFTGHRWIPRTKVSDAELWRFLWSDPGWKVEKQSWGWWFETPTLQSYVGICIIYCLVCYKHVCRLAAWWIFNIYLSTVSSCKKRRCYVESLIRIRLSRWVAETQDLS